MKKERNKDTGKSGKLIAIALLQIILIISIEFIIPIPPTIKEIAAIPTRTRSPLF